MIDDIVALTKQLISVPSVSNDVEQLVTVLDVAKQYLKDHKPQAFSSNNIPSLLYSNKGEETKHFKIILNAHLDVVPANKEQFEPHEKDGKLYGRGAYDMKSAGAVMIYLFKELAPQLPYTLGLQLVTDEETSGSNGTGHQIDKGVRAEFVICGEGTGFRIVNETKGIMNVKLTAEGKTAHSAYPWLGRNAVWQMYQALDNIIKLYPIPKEESPQTTVNIATISSDNSAHNIVPDNCTAYLNFRYTPNEETTIVSKLQSVLPAGIKLEVVRKDVPSYANPKGFFITKLKEQAKEVLQTDVPFVRAHGASDTRFFKTVGCEAVEFGPVGHGHHGDDECVYLNSLEQYYTILKNFLLSLK